MPQVRCVRLEAVAVSSGGARVPRRALARGGEVNFKTGQSGSSLCEASPVISASEGSAAVMPSAPADRCRVWRFQPHKVFVVGLDQ